MKRIYSFYPLLTIGGHPRTLGPKLAAAYNVSNDGDLAGLLISYFRANDPRVSVFIKRFLDLVNSTPSVQSQAATKIQAGFRGLKARRDVVTMKDAERQRVEVATKIQARFRGIKARKEATRLRKEADARRAEEADRRAEEAAAALQRAEAEAAAALQRAEAEAAARQRVEKAHNRKMEAQRLEKVRTEEAERNEQQRQAMKVEEKDERVRVKERVSPQKKKKEWRRK